MAFTGRSPLIMGREAAWWLPWPDMPGFDQADATCASPPAMVPGRRAGGALI